MPNLIIDVIAAGKVKLEDISNINIILGRNGAGKSRFLREIEDRLYRQPEYYVRYISPERAGVFQRDGNIITNMEANKDWMPTIRRKNQVDNFKPGSATLLREARDLFSDKIEADQNLRLDLSVTFQSRRLDKINHLLLNVMLERVDGNFVFKALDGQTIEPNDVSSGESEAVALAAEIMYFFDTIKTDRTNLLLIDEPDVHLHPDLQARLAQYIIGFFYELDAAIRSRVIVCIATHSTPLVCAFAGSDLASIGTKAFGINTVKQRPASERLKKAAPFFGHPLSMMLSQDTMLILEGEDDERVWQQVSRSAQGAIPLFPILAKTVTQQLELEEFCAEMLGAIYDTPRAFSLRDGDGRPPDLLTPSAP